MIWNYKERASLMWQIMGKLISFLSTSTFSLYNRLSVLGGIISFDMYRLAFIPFPYDYQNKKQ